MTYRTANEPLPLFASKLDELEHIDHTLNLESLQLSMQGDEHSSATNPIAVWVRGEVVRDADMFTLMHK